METHRTLLTAGSNAKGQLGIGSYDDAHVFTPCRFANCQPHQLPHLTSRIRHIACGANHTVLLIEHLGGSITAWCTGDGRRGQLGQEFRDGVTIFHNLPMPLSSLYAPRGYTYKLIAAAWETTYVVLSCPGVSDVLVSMGSNDFGALGIGEETSRPSGPGPHVVTFDHLIARDSKDCAEPPRISIQSLYAGPRHVVAELTVITTTDNTSPSSTAGLVGWGGSRHGQLGENERARFVSRPTSLPINIQDDPMISCALGNQHTVILHESGRISTLGSNKQGQIPPISPRENNFVQVGCTWNSTFIQTTKGDKPFVLSMGNNAQGQLGRRHSGPASMTAEAVELPSGCAISALICGSEHVLVRMSGSSAANSSTVMGWGWNEHGNMGLGSLGNVDIPMQLWPREDIEEYTRYPQRVIDIWAGCATSWLLVE